MLNLDFDRFNEVLAIWGEEINNNSFNTDKYSLIYREYNIDSNNNNYTVEIYKDNITKEVFVFVSNKNDKVIKIDASILSLFLLKQLS